MIKKQEVEAFWIPNPDYPTGLSYVAEFDESGDKTGGHWENADGQQWTEAELNDIERQILQKHVTTYTYVDGELSNDGDTAAIETVLTDADDVELATVFKEFSRKNVEYRADGPTTVIGDSRSSASAQYNWGTVPYDIALEGHLAKGLISQDEYDQAMDKYNNSLVKEADLSNPELVSALFSGERAVDFADDCVFITNLLAKDGLPSLGGDSGSGSGSSSSVYDSGWTEIGGQFFRRVDYTIFGQGTVSSPEVADLTSSQFAPTHPISVSAHYEADQTISNPVYNEGAVLKVNSNNGQPVVWSGSWSVTSPIPGAPIGNTATVTSLTAEPSDTSVVLTWEVE